MSDIEESVEPLQPVFVTILTPRESEDSGSSSGVAKPFEATILSLQGRELELSVPCSLAIHTPLKIESPEAIWLGTVLSCYPPKPVAAGATPSGAVPAKQWTVFVSVSRVLKDFDTLERLAALFGSRSALRLRVLRRAIIQV